MIQYAGADPAGGKGGIPPGILKMTLKKIDPTLRNFCTRQIIKFLPSNSANPGAVHGLSAGVRLHRPYGVRLNHKGMGLDPGI